MKERPLIIVVDDNQDNLAIVVDILSNKYQIKIANNGPRALQLARDFKPDLILLDIMMPGMSGFEVCSHLKEDANLFEVPVVFISAAGDIDNKIEAFRLGGVDYINKPFQVAELEARVHTHISLHHLQQKLSAHNDVLDHEVREKSKELAEAHDRLQMMDETKNEFLELIAHEMRTPANGIIGLSEVMFELAPSTPELTEMRSHFNRARKRMVDTLDNALLLAEIHVTGDEFKKETVDFETLLQNVCDTVSDAGKERGQIDIKILGGGPFFVQGNTQLYEKATSFLLKTAMAFTRSGKPLCVELTGLDDHVSVRLVAEGNGVGDEYIESFFEIFSSVRSHTYAEELGLSPALGKKIFALYGGDVLLENLANQTGVSITVLLPCCKA